MIPDPPHVTIYTQGWSEDQAADDDHPATAQLFCRVTLDGVEVPGLAAVQFNADGRDFSTVTLVINPAFVQVLALDHNEFQADVLP